MPNNGLFTQIWVLQDFREKKLKSKKKQQMGQKIRTEEETTKSSSAVCCNSVAIILSGQSGRKNVATKLNNVAI